MTSNDVISVKNSPDKVSVNEVMLVKYDPLMNMSKYPSLPNFELLPSKMPELQGFQKYLLLHHNDIIET